MRHFSVAPFEYGGTIRFLRCVGDEYGMCNKCKAKFECFTGEIKYDTRYFDGHTNIDKNLEESLFGGELFIIEYDIEKHNEYYNTKISPIVGARIIGDHKFQDFANLTNGTKCAIMREDESS